MDNKHIVILGNGISGITAARQIRKLSSCRISVISSESQYFFSRTALMYIYMGHMRLKDTQPYEAGFWKKNKIELKMGHVSSLDTSTQSLIFENGESINYDRLILAVGSKSNKFGWPGQDLDGVHGLYSLQDLEAMERHSEGLEKAVIVGGGLIGIEMAEMFATRNIPVTMLVRESSYWNNVLPPDESEMVNDHIRQHGIDFRLSSELKEIVDDGNGKVDYVETTSGERLDCGFVGLTAGVSPNVDFLKDSNLNIEKGIVVNEYLETNIKGVFAIGDCAQLSEPREGRRPIEAVWYTGRMMGEVVAYNALGREVAYDPGIWFNSAKFFDIEYQVYGNVPAKIEAPLDSILWVSDDSRKAIRIVYNSTSKIVAGFNLMGVRFRHEVCEKWIRDQMPMPAVLNNLQLANFDPEFYDDHHRALKKMYDSKFGVDENKQTGSLNDVITFINS